MKADLAKQREVYEKIMVELVCQQNSKESKTDTVRMS